MPEENKPTTVRVPRSQWVKAKEIAEAETKRNGYVRVVTAPEVIRIALDYGFDRIEKGGGALT